MSGALDGVKVVDVSAVMSGPLAATILADQGADVIKVEPPMLGDILRHLGSNKNGMSGMFHVANRGKRSVVLDLRQDEGIALLRELAADADVFIQNFRPGVADRMGIGFEELSAGNPGLVYCSISGFGSEGPYSGQRVYDNVIQVYSGLADIQGDPMSGEPQLHRQLLCDKLTSVTAASAIASALYARETGRGGQHIDLAMLDAAIAFHWPDSGADHTLLDDDVAHQPTIGSNYSLMAFADGWGTATPLSDSEFRGWCKAYGREDIADDERFSTLPARMANLPAFLEVAAEVGAVAETMPKEEAAAKMAAEDVPSGIVRTIDELHEDPQVVHNEVFVEREHPLAGRLREPRPAARFSATPAAPGGPAPALGQHTDEVLAELGHGDRIADLRERGIVA
ncbi:MAG: CaiB/BaiF CoA-transferase family protein [Actinomycetota bacterium]